MKTVISSYQATLIITITIIGTSMESLPSLLIQEANQDAWISLLLITIVTLLVGIIYFALAKNMKRVDLINYSRKVFGNFFTIPLALILIIAFFLLAGVVIRETSEIMENAYMPLTPLWFYNLTILLAAILIVFYGLEVIGRSLEIGFYIFIAFLSFVIIILISEMSFANLQPVLAGGIGPVIKGSYQGLTFYIETFIILILAPQITNKEKVYKSFFCGVIISTIILLSLILTILMIFGPYLAKDLSIPVINMISFVKKFMIIERLDPFFIFFWIAGGIYKAAIFIYVAVYIAQKLFNRANYYIFLIPSMPIVFYISSKYFLKNIAELQNFIIGVVPYYISIFIIYPLILYLVAKIRGVEVNEKKQ